MKNKSNSLAVKMLISMLLGLGCGILCIFLRENVLDASAWAKVNQFLFQDITAEGATNALGLFYLIGQLFVNALQIIIVPMVFVSIALAISSITDTKKLGRISYKTLGIFLLTTSVALLIAGIVGTIIYHMGAFNAVSDMDITVSTGSTGSNPLLIILNIIPNNILSAFSTNGRILSVVFVAVVLGLAMNQLEIHGEAIKKLLIEVQQVITIFLSYVVNKFAPLAIFVLLTRTFAVYGISYLKPAMVYVVTTVVLLLLYLIVGYSAYVKILGQLDPRPFIKKITKVAVFGFSTSSSAATLPMNLETTTKDLGVSEEISSFVLPLGSTVNMDGTAIMQVIASIFVAASAGYDITFTSIIVIGVLALIASIGTPAAPGAGAVILFTILTGMGYVNDAALLAYSIILSINRPIEMLVTALNVVGDSSTALIVAKSEGSLDEKVYHES